MRQLSHLPPPRRLVKDRKMVYTNVQKGFRPVWAEPEDNCSFERRMWGKTTKTSRTKPLTALAMAPSVITHPEVVLEPPNTMFDTLTPPVVVDRSGTLRLCDEDNRRVGLPLKMSISFRKCPNALSQSHPASFMAKMSTCKQLPARVLSAIRSMSRFLPSSPLCA